MADTEPIGFRTWIMTRARVTDNPAGDFIHDARHDPQFPEVRTREQLIGYLRLRGACEDPIQAADPVWRRWRDYRRRHAGWARRPLVARGRRRSG